MKVAFIDELMADNVSVDDLDDFVDEWHEFASSHHVPLHEFLGLSFREWGVVFREPSALQYVVAARKAGIETEFPLIVGCACGKDHMTMPSDTETVNGVEVTVELVCVVHRKHEPCRPCLRASFANDRFRSS